MPIQVFVADEQSDRPVEPGRWGELSEAILGDLTGAGSNVELNILFVDERTIASLNERFLGHEGPTDVLSFPIEDKVPGAAGLGPPGSMLLGGSGPGRWDEGDKDDPPIGPAGEQLPTLLGDVVICPAVAAANAPGHAGSFAEELALLVVHGILHLFGMDHEDEDEAAEMEALEQRLLDQHFRSVRA